MGTTLASRPRTSATLLRRVLRVNERAWRSRPWTYASSWLRGASAAGLSSGDSVPGPQSSSRAARTLIKLPSHDLGRSAAQIHQLPARRVSDLLPPVASESRQRERDSRGHSIRRYVVGLWPALPTLQECDDLEQLLAAFLGQIGRARFDDRAGLLGQTPPRLGEGAAGRCARVGLASIERVLATDAGHKRFSKNKHMLRIGPQQLFRGLGGVGAHLLVVIAKEHQQPACHADEIDPGRSEQRRRLRRYIGKERCLAFSGQAHNNVKYRFGEILCGEQVSELGEKLPSLRQRHPRQDGETDLECFARGHPAGACQQPHRRASAGFAARLGEIRDCRDKRRSEQLGSPARDLNEPPASLRRPTCYDRPFHARICVEIVQQCGDIAYRVALVRYCEAS